MGATREELLNLADFWESRGDHAEAARLRSSAEVAGAVVAWTGQRMMNAGLLYESYRNLANVRSHDGRLLGTILELPSGKYKASTWTQVCVGREFATEAEALERLVAYVEENYR